MYGSDGRLLFFNSHFSEFWKLGKSWHKKGITYTEVIHKIHESKRFTDDSSLELLKKQQYELFGKLSEPYHDTLALKDGTLEMSVVPNHRQELLFLYNHHHIKNNKQNQKATAAQEQNRGI